MVPSIPGEHSGLAPRLIDIVKAVERIARSTSQPFSVVRTPGGAEFRSSDLGKHITDLLGLPRHDFRQLLCLYDTDPRVSLFWEEAERRKLAVLNHVQPWTGEASILTSVDAMNGFVEAVRKRYSHKGFRSKVDVHVRATNMKYAEVRDYLMRLRLLFPDLLPITLGLSYQYGAPRGAENSAQALRIVSDQITSLAVHARSAYGDAVVGHAWAQDAFFGNGHVGHLLLLLSGSIDSNEAFALPQAVGRYWTDHITDGEGCFYDNLATQDARFYFRGVSPDERRWTPMEEQLRRMAIYLAFTDRFLALKRSPGAKTHGMGKLPKPPRATPVVSAFPFPQIAGGDPCFYYL